MQQDEDLPTLAEFATNPERLRKLVDLFIQQSEETLDVLSKNCSDGPNAAWTEAAHKLKGTAFLIKAKKLAVLCELAEKMASSTAAERKAVFGEITAVYTNAKTVLIGSLSS
jgi:HPt (histidine-containing phosphotransfer) domain-containing protein